MQKKSETPVAKEKPAPKKKTTLATKFQIKKGQTAAIIGSKVNLSLRASIASPQKADAVIVFVKNKSALEKKMASLISFARAGKIVWVSYPKGKQLRTDLDRNTIWELCKIHGLDAVRQIAIDELWSALRIKTVQIAL